MRTTVSLDDDVFEAVTTLARSSGKRFGEVLSVLVRRALVRGGPPRRRGRRFPAFDLPPDAPMIPAGRIQRILEEEDKT